jgi:hypothetical protein
VIDINLFELADHLKLAIKAFVARLKRHKRLAEATEKQFDQLSQPVTVKELRIGPTTKENSISKSRQQLKAKNEKLIRRARCCSVIVP